MPDNLSTAERVPLLSSELAFCLGVLSAYSVYWLVKCANAMYRLTLTVYHAYRVARSRIALREYLDAHAHGWQGDPLHALPAPSPDSPVAQATTERIADVLVQSGGWVQVGPDRRH